MFSEVCFEKKLCELIKKPFELISKCNWFFKVLSKLVMVLMLSHIHELMLCYLAS